MRWVAPCPALADGRLPELPDPYEPLPLMFERGGGCSIEEFIDLYGVMIPRGSFESSLAAEPFLTPVSITLDALDQDAEGRITCYARISDDHSRSSPRGIVRRRVVGRDGGTHDEAFARNLRWKPTEHLRLRSEGHNDVDHVRISGREAAAFIESVTERLAGTP
ncbi:hypothetical protein GCM10009549_40720 [Streptomyces thermoalcalitolerans]|uniref:Uncharacterized protein n=1 Tax=Streptomyces thermoalcalitolerans TaxID=65605 RepID=A0ABN1P1Z6_9ACTN